MAGIRIICLVLSGATVLADLAAAAAVSQPAADSALLDAPFQPPDWLATTASTFSDQRLEETNRYGLTIWSELTPMQSDPEKFRQAVATVHRALDLQEDPLYVNGSNELVRKYLPKYLDLRDQMLAKAGKLAPNLGGLDERIQVIASQQDRWPTMELNGLVDGTYSASAAGMHGPVQAVVTVKGGKVADMKVLGHERCGFNAPAVQAQRIAATSALPVDAVSGATVTSLAVQQAAAEALLGARRHH